MPNWASTTYVMKAEPVQAKDLYDKIESLNQMKEPLVENGFGKLWMGCLVNLLGGDWNKVYCRGEITSCDLEDDHVCISCETAWGEMPEFRHFLEQQYPGQKSIIAWKNVVIAFMPQMILKVCISKTDTASTSMMDLNTLRPSRLRQILSVRESGKH